MPKPANKVVSIKAGNPDSGNSQAGTHSALSAPLQKLRDRGRQMLLQLLQGMFDNADDALFELADKAQTNAEQNVYFESMRDIRLKRRMIEAAFAQLIPQAFTVVTVAANDADDEDNALEAGSLSLVQKDELEEQVAIDSIVARLLNSESDALRELTQRVDSLVAHTQIDENNNPVGPRVVCDSFMKACECLEVDLKSKLVVYKLFEKQLLTDFTTIHDDCNQLLRDEGILPGLSSSSKSSGKSGRARAAAQGQGEQAHSGVAANEEQVASDQVFSNVQNLLAQQQGYLLGQELLRNANWFLPGAAPELPRTQIFDLLGRAQNQMLSGTRSSQSALTGAADKPGILDVHGLLKSMLAEQDVQEQRSLGQVDFDAINLVSMLFQFILDDGNLADPMKALIARLQIPLLKAAMLDKSFFGTEGHPARKLLNQIATAALGWVPAEGKDKGKDPLLSKVQHVVDTVLGEYDQDQDVFARLLQDFELFLQQENKRASLLEKRAIDAADGKAKSAQARQLVQDTLDEKLANTRVPEVVEQLLREAWSNVMFLAYVRAGTDSDAWQDALGTAEQLLWSVADGVEDRSREQLLTVLPDLLRKLREGLTQISYDPFKMNALFTDLEQVHLRILGRQLNPDPEPNPEPDSSESTAELADTLDNERSPGSRADDPDLSLDDIDAALLQADDLPDSVELDADMDELLSDVDGLLGTEGLSPAMEDETSDVFESSGEGSPDDAQEHSVAVDVEATYIEMANRLRVGSWVEVRTEDQPRFRAKLAAKVPPEDTHIFVNRSGIKVLELPLRDLAGKLQLDAIRMLDDGALFDRALQSVITNLRSVKKPVA